MLLALFFFVCLFQELTAISSRKKRKWGFQRLVCQKREDRLPVKFQDVKFKDPKFKHEIS